MIDETNPVDIKKKDEEDSSPNNPNIEWKNKSDWKKKGFDHREVVSRNVNKKEAMIDDAKKKTNVNNNDGKKIAPVEQVPLELNKMRKKIKDIYDEEEEDENSFQTVAGSGNDNSLMNALTDEEKKAANGKETFENIKIMDNAAKMEAINLTDKMFKEAGAKINQETITKRTDDATYNKSSMNEALKKDISKQLNIKKPGKIPASKHKDLIEGVKKIKEKGGKVSGMKVNDVAQAAKASDKGVAEIIYKTAATPDKKKIHDKAEVKSFIDKTGRGKPTEKTIEKQSIKQIEKGNIRIDTREQKDR